MHLELLETARKLTLASHDTQPSETDLRRSVSTAYYALFHFISASCVEALFEASVKDLSRAKEQAYRSLEHRDIAAACERANRPEFGFPADIQNLAGVFAVLQKRRFSADYDRRETGAFSLQHAQHLIKECESAISGYETVEFDDRLAFSVLVSLKTRIRR